MDLLEIPPLNDGETYVGLIGDAQGNRHHVILLPGDSDPASWAEQMRWANSIGGHLPTRIEQAMLWANHRDQFKQDWYWSCKGPSSESCWHWFQTFGDGYQHGTGPNHKLRARAVRRVPV